MDSDRFAGMTVNERIFEEGLIDVFYCYVEAKNLEGVRSILHRVSVDPPSIEKIVQMVIAGDMKK